LISINTYIHQNVASFTGSKLNKFFSIFENLALLQEEQSYGHTCFYFCGWDLQGRPKKGLGTDLQLVPADGTESEHHSHHQWRLDKLYLRMLKRGKYNFAVSPYL
jgi:hypothetical protein